MPVDVDGKLRPHTKTNSCSLRTDCPAGPSRTVRTGPLVCAEVRATQLGRNVPRTASGGGAVNAMGTQDRSAARSPVRWSGLVWYLILAVLALGVVWSLWTPAARAQASVNLHAAQADAFVHGRLTLDHGLPDAASYSGKSFSPYPPAPAVLLTPVVAVFGLHGPTPLLLAFVLSGVAAIYALRICRRAVMQSRQAQVLTLGLLLGTAYWSQVIDGNGVWGLSHVCAVAFLLVAFDSALRGRGLATGICLGVAFLSRQFTICALPFLLALLWERVPTTRRRWAVVRVLAPIGVLGGAYLVFNAARFSGPIDTGYSYIRLTGFLQARVDEHGLFSVAYVAFNFTYMFLQGFHVNYRGATMLHANRVDPFGTSLPAASPFLFFAVKAHQSRTVMVAAAVSIGTCLMGILLYYNNGFLQTNAQRFSLDFVPMLFVLCAFAVPRLKTRWWEAAVWYSIALNFLALVVLGS